MPSVRVSTIPTPVRRLLPVFLTVILYTITSPALVAPSPFVSTKMFVLVTSMVESVVVKTIVGSLVVLPSLSSPSSLTSDTSLVPPGLLPVAVTTFLTLPVFPAA